MRIEYSLLLLAVLVVAWIAVRRVIGRPRRRLDKYSKWRKRRGNSRPLTQSGSPRSSMRAFDDPTTTMDSLGKARWKGGMSSRRAQNSKVSKKR
jgi:hypothetical protein